MSSLLGLGSFNRAQVGVLSPSESLVRETKQFATPLIYASASPPELSSTRPRMRPRSLIRKDSELSAGTGRAREAVVEFRGLVVVHTVLNVLPVMFCFIHRSFKICYGRIMHR
jgi:hypothetical protein